MSNRPDNTGHADHGGVSHWWWQKITAVALIPLSFWFVAGIVSHVGSDQEAIASWVGSGFNAFLIILFVLNINLHSQIGVQVVIDDYIHGEALKRWSSLSVKVIHLLFALFSVIAVLSLTF